MGKKNSKSKISFLIIISLIFILTDISAQKRPLPDMYVPKKDGIKRQANFILKSFFIEQGLRIDQIDSIFFPVKSFIDMIRYFENSIDYKYLNVVFATFSKKSNPKVPKDWENQMTILFQPLEGTSSNYYLIPDNGVFDPVDSKLPNEISKKWIDNYKIYTMASFINTINKKDPENHKNNQASEPFSDTRSIMYCKEDIQQLIDEINYQDSIHDPNNTGKKYVTGLMAYFSSYDRHGNDSHKFKKRLIIQFEFTTNDKEVFYIEDDANFANTRSPKKHVCPEPFEKAPDLLSYDNGQICPPCKP